MNKLKSLFKPNVKTSDSLESRSETNGKSLILSPSVETSAYNTNLMSDIQFTSSSDLDDYHSSNDNQAIIMESKEELFRAKGLLENLCSIHHNCLIMNLTVHVSINHLSKFINIIMIIIVNT